VSDDEMVGAYAKRVGERLRTIRRQQRHSLQGVEEASGQEFKASVLGAYERGERSISVPRLQRLAKFYSVPVDQLLPRDAGPEPGWSSGGADADGDSPDESITLDLIRLEEVEMPGKDILLRFVNALQVQRQDFNGKVLTMRHDDVRLIALMLGVSSTQLRQALHIAELIA
jgi:transcriptional regulator with XRE-family HTH domain